MQKPMQEGRIHMDDSLFEVSNNERADREEGPLTVIANQGRKYR